MAFINTGNGTTGAATIDQNNDLMTATPQVNTRYGGATGAPNNVGAQRVFCENDPGSVSGTPYLNSPTVTFVDQNLQIGMPTPLFEYFFNGTAQDTGAWYYAITTLTAVQAGGFLVLNSGNVGTAASGVYLNSKRYFNLTNNGGMRFGTILNITLPPGANQYFAVGLGIPATTTTPPVDGVWFQYSSEGLIGVVSFNGLMYQTGPLPLGQTPQTIPINTNVLLQIRMHDRELLFMYNGNIIGALPVPAGQGTPFLSQSIPAFVSYVNTGTVPGSNFMQLRVASMALDQIDSNLGKP